MSAYEYWKVLPKDKHYEIDGVVYVEILRFKQIYVMLFDGKNMNTKNTTSLIYLNDTTKRTLFTDYFRGWL